MKLSTRLKRLLYPAYILPRVTKGRKKANALFRYYTNKSAEGIPVRYNEQPFQLFSNLDEDGIILWIMGGLGIEKGRFIDIGSNDCINSNCANLVLNFNWTGVFIDSQRSLLDIGKRNYRLFKRGVYPEFRFVCAFVTAGNINQLITDNAGTNEIDLVSIDIDGDDYSIFHALTAVRPKCFVVENMIEFGKYDIVVPGSGASVTAMTKLATSKGYTLVAANKSGFNTFYLRNDLVSQLLPPLALETLFANPDINRDFYDKDTMEKLSYRHSTSAV